MKYTFWGFGLIMAGLTGLIFIVMFEAITINNESEYYTLKETMEASMLESVDLQCFRLPKGNGGCGGDVKISEQKFVENFLKRFGRSVSGDVTSYKIDFYDIMESPPKATVVITGRTQTYRLSSNSDDMEFNLVNNLTGIIETKKS